MNSTTYIIEGPDGSGKSQLCKRLSGLFGLGINPRPVTSLGGPKENLWEWVTTDQHHRVRDIDMGLGSIYDRHPLIGEYIHGPLLRDGVQKPFATPEAHLYRLQLLTTTTVIICLPPRSVVQEAVLSAPSAHLSGIAEHIDNIYDEYQNLARDLRLWVWDYTKLQNPLRKASR